MPASTSRPEILHQIKAALLLIASNPSLANRPDLIIPLLILYRHARSTRYIQRQRPDHSIRHRSMITDVPRILEVPAEDFRQELRVSKATFTAILELIESDDVFKPLPNGRPQAPAMYQLAVALWRMTHNGNGAAVTTIARTFGCAEGTVGNYTDRVIAALLNIESMHTYWPKEQERAAIARGFDDDHRVPGGCVGAIDGCHIVLWARPGTEDAGDFFSRKGSYSYNVQMICDNRKLIRHVQIGHAGSAHDARVFSTSPFIQNPQSYFDLHQFIIGDSAYPPGDHLIPVFKREIGQTGLNGDEGYFNNRLSKARVLVEHSFGMLKGRFSSLQGLRIGHTRPEDQTRAAAWIRACIILHNFIIRLQSPVDDLTEVELAQGEVGNNIHWDMEQGYQGGMAPRGRARDHPRRRRLMVDMGLRPSDTPTATGRARRSQAPSLDV